MSGSPQIEIWLAVNETAESANRRLVETKATHFVWVESFGELTGGAEEAIAATLARFGGDLLYGDGTAPDGSRIERPVFSPLRLREQNYLGPVVVFSVEWARSAGGFDPLAEGVQSYDLALRLDVSPDRVVRIPEMISLERAAGRMGDAEAAAVRRRIASLGLAADVSTRSDGSRRVGYSPVADPLVSIVIPTRGSSATIHGGTVDLVVEAVRGVMERTDYRDVEIVVVADDPTPQHVIDELRLIAGDRLRLVRYSDPFNFSAKVNRGAVYSRGEFLLLLNDDVEILEPQWLTTMVGLAQQQHVGIVGALLLFEDGTVQHGGHQYRESWAGHIESPHELGEADILGGFGVTREVSGVTAACALVRATTYREVGGLSTEFPGNYNDVDLCLKIRATGATAVWSPDARLFHFESKTRDATILTEEIGRLRERWGTRLLLDPYWPASPGRGNRGAAP